MTEGEGARKSGPEGMSDVIDPVCGMTVSAEDAAAAWEFAGETYLFCSVGCMERFREDPDRFLSMDDADRRM
jgi:Cu+-exporting ATPase